MYLGHHIYANTNARLSEVESNEEHRTSTIARNSTSDVNTSRASQNFSERK